MLKDRGITTAEQIERQLYCLEDLIAASRLSSTIERSRFEYPANVKADIARNQYCRRCRLMTFTTLVLFNLCTRTRYATTASFFVGLLVCWLLFSRLGLARHTGQYKIRLDCTLNRLPQCTKYRSSKRVECNRNASPI